jgi:hypothetical protein
MDKKLKGSLYYFLGFLEQKKAKLSNAKTLSDFHFSCIRRGLCSSVHVGSTLELRKAKNTFGIAKFYCK